MLIRHNRAAMAKTGLLAAMAAAAMGTGAPAGAALVEFIGTRENATPVPIARTGRCVPPHFRTISIVPGNFSSTGTSNLGAFTADMNHCEDSADPVRDALDGLFTFTFDSGDTLFGTYTGQIAPALVTHSFVVTGGTGQFAGASGAIAGAGNLRGGLVDGKPAGIYTGALAGSIELAVPEPSSWAMLIVGFGAIGGAMRRRPRRIAAFS